MEKELKFLHLVLFSHSNIYDSMYEITSVYYNKFQNVKTIYYAYSNEITEEFVLKNNILYIKGIETYVPGILDKTIKCFKYFEEDVKDKKYDYIVRSNISTIIRFDNLESTLYSSPVHYGGGLIHNIDFLDYNCGIVDNTYFGTFYCSGTNIILSPSTFLKMMLNIHHINMNIIDDISIGILINQCLNITPTLLNKFMFVPHMNENMDDLYNYLNNNQHIIFYRNENGNRIIDVNQMKYIVSFLINEMK